MALKRLTLGANLWHDKRDYHYPVLIAGSAQYYSDNDIDISHLMPEIIDQGILPTCVGQAGRSTMGTAYSDVQLSAMQMYCRAQLYDELQGEDYDGTSLSGLCKALLKEGVCAANLWIYGNTVGAQGWLEDAAKRKILSYHRISIGDIYEIQRQLVTYKKPILISYIVRDHLFNYFGRPNAVIDEQLYTNSKYVGGHGGAICGVLFIEGKVYIKVANSWGKHFNDEGYGIFPYSLLKRITKNVYVVVTDKDAAFDLKLRQEQLEAKRNAVQKFFYKLKDLVNHFRATVERIFKKGLR